MQRNSVISTAILIGALFSSTAWTKPGFFQPDDPNLPPAVREASKSVLRIEFPMFPGFPPSSPKGQEVLSKLEAGLAEMDEFLKALLQPQINTCKAHPNQECWIYDRGSAFPAGQADQLWTAMHNSDFFLIASMSQGGWDMQQDLDVPMLKKMKTIRIPIRLFTSDGRQVFGGAEEYAVLDDVDPLYLTGIAFAAGGNTFDYIRLRLSRPLQGVKPLQFETDRQPAIGERAFVAGWPRKTSDRQTLGAPDADGQSLRVSEGQVLSMEEGHQRWGAPMPTGQALLFFGQAELHIAADCGPGNSGGAALAANGKVIGLFNSSAPRDDDSVNPKRDCFAVRAVRLVNPLN